MKISPVLLLTLLLPYAAGYSQTGPGGVGNSTNIEAWMDASRLSLSNNNPVSSWIDFSDNNNDASQPAGASQPIFLTNQINGLPVVDFDGVNDFLDFSNNIVADDATIFVVNRSTLNTRRVMLGTEHHLLFSNTNILEGIYTSPLTVNSVNKPTNQFTISSMQTGSNPTSGAIQLRSGNQLTSGTRSAYTTRPTSSIGTRYNSSGVTNLYHQGQFAEIIYYNEELNSAKRKIVGSYLAAKYNLTAEQSLYSYESTHGKDVIGIGQESDGNHLESRGLDSLKISNTSPLSNGDYLLVGNDGGDFSSSTDVDVDASQRWTKIWRADLTGTPGTVDLTFYLGANDFATDPNNYVVLIESSDGIFSNGGTSTQESGRVYDPISKTVTFSGINLTNGAYFTLAEKTGIVVVPLPPALDFGPGGVGNSTNIEAWMDASRLSLSNNNPVSSWTDFSGNNNDASQQVSSSQPIFLTNQINGLPVVDFDGVNDFLDFSNNIVADDATIFVVNRNTLNTRRVILGTEDHLLFSNTNTLESIYTSPLTINSVNKPTNQFTISSMQTGSNPTSGAIQLRSGNQLTSGTRSAYTTRPTSSIGTRYNSSGVTNLYHQGQFAEIIYYNEELNSAKRKIVGSYLAAKYNLTAEQNLYSHKAAHGIDVIGIGQESNGSHLESRGFDSLKISNASTLGNGDYLLVGNDGGDFNTSTDVGALTTHRWNKIWRADITGTPGTIDLTFYLGNNDFAIDPNKYAVIVEDVDGNFANGGTSIQETGRVYDATAKTVTFTGITLNDGDYFTLSEKKDIPVAIATGNWESTSTWSCNCVPTSSLDVTIPSPFTVTINDLANANSITINSGGTLTIGGNDTIQIVENMTVEGTLNSGATGTILANGTSNQTFANSSGTNVELVNLVSDNSASLLLTGGWTLSNSLQVNAGTLNVSGADSLVLLSNATKTAEILQSNGSFVGDFTLQRFISARNANYSNITAPISNATVASIDDDVKISGVGGSFGNASTSTGGIFYSMFEFDRSNNNSKDTIQSTATALTPGVGYELYLFTTLGSFSATTLDYVGTPNFGTITPPSILSGFNLVGNPYHCHIEPANLDASNIGPTIYIFDSSTGSYSTLGGAKIAPGQGFWVDNTSGGTVQFNFDEGDKSATGSSAFVRRKNTRDFTLELSNSVNYFKNKVTMGFDYSATEKLDQFDARFLPSPIPNSSELYFTTIAEDKLMKNTLNQLDESHVVPLEVKIGEPGTYTIQSSNVSSILENYSCVYLKDQVTNESIDLSVDQDYTFEAASGVSNRFNIVVSNSFEACEKALATENTSQKIDSRLKLRESYGEWFLDYDLGAESQTLVISVYGINGQQVLTRMEVNLSENGTYKLNELNTLNGIFVIQIVGNNEVVNQTIKL